MGVPGPNLGSGDLASAINAMIAERAMQYATPQQLPQVQRSAYLNSALQNIAKSGSQGLRTPAALGSNLAAELILSLAARKANKQLIQADQRNWQNVSGAMRGMIPGLDGSSAPQEAAPATATPPAAAPGPPPIQAAPASAPQLPFYNADPKAKDTLIRAMIGEGGDSPEDEAAVLSTVLNRSAKSGLDIMDVLKAPHQFEAVDNPKTWGKLAALDPNSPAYQQAAGVADRVLNDGPTGPWTNFYSPGAQAALGRAKPSWDNGTGQQIGKQLFFNLDGGNPSPSSARQASPAPMPLQVSTGPDPSIPSPNPGAPVPPSPPAPANSAPPASAGGAAPPQGAWALGPVPIQPQQRQRLDQLGALAQQNPAFRQQYMEYLGELQKQASTPEPFDSQIVDGQAILTGKITGRRVVQPVQALQYRDVQAPTPNVAEQRGPDNQLHITELHNYGPLPEGSHLQGAGLVVQAPASSGIVSPVTKALQTSRDSFRTNEDVKKANEGIAAYNGLVGALGQMTKNNGVLDTAAVDSYLRGINPGMGARNTTVSMFLNHLGLPQEIQSHVIGIMGNGYLTPETLHQMVGVIKAYAGAHVQIAQNLANQDLQAFKPYGVTPEQLGENLTPFSPMPNVAWMQPAPAQAAARPVAPEQMSRAQLEAEAKRLGIKIDPRTGRVVQ